MLKKILLSISKNTRRVAKNLSSEDRERNQLLKDWKKQDDEQNLRLNYPTLDTDSIVFDLGGYKGDWASHIYSMYRCEIYVFEPHPVYYHQIKERFSKNDDILVYEQGLGARTENFLLSTDEDSSSAFKKGSNMVEAQIINISDFLKEYGVEQIDLMKINIEGGEYDLLDFLIDEGWIKKINNLQIQFHDFVPKALERMKSIQENLRKTHETTYSYRFFWENWKLKS